MATEGEGAPAGGEPGTPATGAAGGTPPAAGAGAKPPAVQPAAGAKPTPAAKPPKKDDKPPPFDKHPAFRKRVDQEAARQIQRQLGCSLDEAKALIAAARAGAGAGGAPAAVPTTSAAADAAMLKEVEKLTTKVKELTRRIENQKGKLQKQQRAHRNRVVDLEIQHEALGAGVQREHLDFALSLYRRDCAGRKPEEIVEAPKFFAGLRKTRPYLFSAAAPEEVIVDGSTAPPESKQPGEETPKPAGAGTPAPGVDVDKMDDQAFGAHLQKYGYRRGS